MHFHTTRYYHCLELKKKCFRVLKLFSNFQPGLTEAHYHYALRVPKRCSAPADGKRNWKYSISRLPSNTCRE